MFPVGVWSKESIGSINSLHISDEPREVKEILYYNGNRYSRDDSFSYKTGSLNYTSQGKHKTTPKKYQRVTNNPDLYEDVIRCLVCDSVMHLKKYCPHRSDEEYSISQEECLEESDHVQYSDDSCCTYEIVQTEHHVVHPCPPRIGEKPFHIEKPTWMQATYMDEEEVDEYQAEEEFEFTPDSHLHEYPLDIEENTEQNAQHIYIYAF